MLKGLLILIVVVGGTVYLVSESAGGGGKPYKGTLSAPHNATKITFDVGPGRVSIGKITLSSAPALCAGAPATKAVHLREAHVSKAGHFATGGVAHLSSGVEHLRLRGTLTGPHVSGTLTAKSPTCSGTSAFQAAAA